MRLFVVESVGTPPAIDNNLSDKVLAKNVR